MSMASTISCSNEPHSLKMSYAGKNFLFFFSKIFWPFFFLRLTASRIMRRNEESFLVRLLDEEAVLHFQTSSLPFCVLFRVLLHLRGTKAIHRFQAV